MTHKIDPRLLYSNAPFFLDFIEDRNDTATFFQHSHSSLQRLASTRLTQFDGSTRAAVCDILARYNHRLSAAAGTMGNIERLRDANTLCAIGGQQAGFLGGPLFVIYKIASIIRTAAKLANQLDVPVVPIYWMASEDHDFEEINHVRWLDQSGSIRTVSFDWNQQGAPIELLPFTEAVQATLNEAEHKIPFAHEADAQLFAHEAGDDYCYWHARMISRLFAKYGLIVVEPRVLRSLTGPFFRRAIRDRNKTQVALEHSAERLRALDYPVPLDPSRSGFLFEIREGQRHLLNSDVRAEEAVVATTLSSDAATRPVLADSLFPTIANIVGPSELAYHAMLRPMYEQWDIPQPLVVPRQGATLIPEKDLQLLADLDLDINETLHPQFNPAEIMQQLASEELLQAFSDAQDRLEKALFPLKPLLRNLDPGLEKRWRQTVDQANLQVARLKDRSLRADLARRGLSMKRLQLLKPLLLPTGKPQERVFSAYAFVAAYGVQWIDNLIACEEPDQFEHQLIVLKDAHE